MSESTSKTPSRKPDDPQDKPFPWTNILFVDGKKTEKPGNLDKNEGPKIEYKRSDHIGTGKIIELILAFAIAICASLQLVTTLSNNSNTTEQTNQLIAAAKINAYAAQQSALAAGNFANSAQHINQGISDAVDKLNLQAANTQDLVQQAIVQSAATNNLATSAAGSAETASKQLTITQTSQRPWVGIDDPSDMEPNGRGIKFALRLINYGQLPATEIPNKSSFALIHARGGGLELFDRYSVCPQRDKATGSNLEHPRGNVDIVFPGITAGVSQKADAEPTPFDPNPTISESYNILLGCIAYSSSLGGSYRTRVIYYISGYISGPNAPPNQNVTIIRRFFYDAR